MLCFKFVCAVLATWAMVTTAAQCETKDATKPPDEEPVQQFVFFSVLEGLYQLGLSNQVVDRILARDPRSGWPVSFIYACPICMPAYDAFNTYRIRPAFIGSKAPVRDFGAGATEELIRQLTGEDVSVRTAALGKLVQKFVTERIARSRWTIAERTRWEAAFARGRKQGERMLRQFQGRGSTVPGLPAAGPGVSSYMKMDSCAMCDGANAACSAR